MPVLSTVWTRDALWALNNASNQHGDGKASTMASEPFHNEHEEEENKFFNQIKVSKPCVESIYKQMERKPCLFWTMVKLTPIID